MNNSWYYLGALGMERYQYFLFTGVVDYPAARAFLMSRQGAKVSSSPNGGLHHVTAFKNNKTMKFTVVRTPNAPGLPLGNIQLPERPVSLYPSRAMNIFPLGAYHEHILCRSTLPCVHFPDCYGQDGPLMFGDLDLLRAELPDVFFHYTGSSRLVVTGSTPASSFLFYTRHRTYPEMIREVSSILRYIYHGQSIDMRDGLHEAAYTTWMRLCAKNLSSLQSDIRAAQALTDMKFGVSKKKKKIKTPSPDASPRKKARRRGHFIGTSFHKKTGKYEAKIKVRGTVHYLGYHKTAEEGGMAYDAFVRKYNLGRRTNFSV